MRWAVAPFACVVVGCGGCTSSIGNGVGGADDAASAPADADANAPPPADSGAPDAVADTGTQTPDATPDTGVDTRTDTGVDSGVDTGVDSGAEDATTTDAGAPAPGRAAWAMGTTYIQSGHSLTDTVMSSPWPGRLVEAVTLDPAGDFSDVAKATIPGSKISWRWRNAESGGDQTAQWPAEMGQYEGLVITTAVPLYADNAVRQTETVDWLLTAVEDAWQNGDGGNGAPTLLYTTWTQTEADPNEPHPEDHLTFRQRLDRDNARWEQMQDFVNARRPTGQEAMYLIPGHRFMMRVYDDIQAGTAPFSDITDIFIDNIHPNDIGQYAITLLHYACIYGRDPSYLPDRLVAQDTLTAQQAQYFKRIIPQIVTGYARTGLTSLTSPP